MFLATLALVMLISGIEQRNAAAQPAE
jgi:hypothetical protein